MHCTLCRLIIPCSHCRLIIPCSLCRLIIPCSHFSEVRLDGAIAHGMPYIDPPTKNEEAHYGLLNLDLGKTLHEL